MDSLRIVLLLIILSSTEYGDIQEAAEAQAETFKFNSSANYTYYSSRYSPVEGQEPLKLLKSVKKNKYMYLPIKLNNDTHFYNLAVNTNYSSVHVPVNVYDKEKSIAFAIQWSENLTEIFKRNYKSDPALSWQYFGSATGIMRHYPASRWEEKSLELKVFDCRIRTWFIEAATCTKDVVILVDNSGSMDGMSHHIGSLTAYNILDTFSNNDYVNVLNYSSVTNYTIPCFQDMLVQATEENIKIFKQAIGLLKPSGKTQLGQALEMAFDLLAKYRAKRGCDDNNSSCNQAIMVITDGVNSNLSETIIKYNYLNNGSNIPVRIFTYLIGKEVTNVPEIKWISCSNRGYYTHVQSLEQVTAAVVQYINVIARPLVLQGEDHPVSWTHAYADLTYDDKQDMTVNMPYRLLSSAAIPCYDTKINKMNDTMTAYLLGVAGTDVPLDEFERLTVPYKIGVNGYVFIVSNNGYVLMHPDLRPVFEGILKDNYNSIDLTQVEQHHSEGPSQPREVVDTLKRLRQAMIGGEEGSLHDIKLKYHYDDMKRVYESRFDYYFTPIEHTPFTIAIAIPGKYGNYSLEVGDEIFRNKHTGLNLTSFFNGKWKVHPKWVYCKYHYLEGHEFDTPEKELLHFLGRMYDFDFQWKSQYEKDITELHDDDYYCDKQLVQRLIFDAKNTNGTFGEKISFNPRELPLFQRYNASLRFVATMSGLTRWDYIFEEPKNDSKSGPNKEFGDLHPRAINERWYKNAVLQHQYDESLVYSVPFDVGAKEDTLVTASFAIFPSERGLEAPGCVVGFQFSQSKFQARVKEISNKLSNQCSHCSRCNDTLDCYVIDSSGYILVADNQADTGRFFGEIEGDIMESMLAEKIFKKITVYDYQALCEKIKDNGTNSGNIVLSPLQIMQSTFNWILLKVVYFLLEFNIYNLSNMAIYAQNLAQNISEPYLNATDDSTVDEENMEEEENEEEEVKIFVNKADDYYACEMEIELFVMQQEIFIKGQFHGDINRPNERNFYIKRIHNSNLVFIAINNAMPKRSTRFYTTKPQQITKEAIFEYDYMNTTLLPCQKLNLNNMPRRRLAGCYNEHPLEHEIVDCGRTNFIKLDICLFLLCFLAWTI